MTRTTKKGLGQALGWGLGVLAAGTVLYLASGKGQKNSPVIPDSIENHIDSAIAVLNQRFGHAWVDNGLATLDEVLRTILPSSVVGLLDAIVAVERQVQQLEAAGRLVTGTQKRAMAKDRLTNQAH